MIQFKRLFPLYAVICLGFIGYALTITLFIPLIMTQHSGFLPANTSTATRATLSGFLLAMYPLGQFIGSPIIGNLSDRHGRKRVLLISLFGCCIGFFCMWLSITYHQVTWLFVSALFTGLCESNMAISQSVIADISANEEQKSKLIGYAYSSCSFGYFLGPLIGGFFGSLLSHSSPFWITGLGVVLLMVWLAFTFKDTYQPNIQQRLHLFQSLTSIKTLFNRPKLYKFYIVNFLIFFAVQGLYRVAPLYTADTWHPGLLMFSFLIAYVSLLCFLANLLLLGRITKLFSSKSTLIVLLIAGGLLVISIVLPIHFHWIWLTYGAAVIPTVMALPICTTILSNQVPSHEQGQILGNNQALLVLGEASSAAIGGVIAAIYIPLPVIMMGAILIGTALIVAKQF